MTLKQTFFILPFLSITFAALSSCGDEEYDMPDTPNPIDTTHHSDTTHSDTIPIDTTNTTHADTTKTDTTHHDKGGGIGIDDKFGDSVVISFIHRQPQL